MQALQVSQTPNLKKNTEESAWVSSTKLQQEEVTGLFKLKKPHSGLDSLECYKAHTQTLSAPHKTQYQRALRLKTRENFENLNDKLGKNLTLEIMGHKREHFSYSAFGQELTNSRKKTGVSSVVQRAKNPSWANNQLKKIAQQFRQNAIEKDLHNLESAAKRELNKFTSPVGGSSQSLFNLRDAQSMDTFELQEKLLGGGTDELSQMRKQGIYSFQKGYESMGHLRRTHELKHQADVIDLVDKFLDVKKAREEADQDKRYLIDVLKGNTTAKQPKYSKDENKTDQQREFQFVLSNPYELKLQKIKKQAYTIKATEAEKKEMVKYQALYNANKVAHKIGVEFPTTLQGSHSDYPLLRYNIDKGALEKLAVKKTTHAVETLNLLKDRKKRLLTEFDKKDVKYMTKDEVALAMVDLGDAGAQDKNHFTATVEPLDMPPKQTTVPGNESYESIVTSVSSSKKSKPLARQSNPFAQSAPTTAPPASLLKPPMAPQFKKGQIDLEEVEEHEDESKLGRQNTHLTRQTSILKTDSDFASMLTSPNISPRLPPRQYSQPQSSNEKILVSGEELSPINKQDPNRGSLNTSQFSLKLHLLKENQQQQAALESKQLPHLPESDPRQTSSKSLQPSIKSSLRQGSQKNGYAPPSKDQSQMQEVKLGTSTLQVPTAAKSVPHVPSAKKKKGFMDKVMGFFGKKEKLDESQDINFPESPALAFSDHSSQRSGQSSRQSNQQKSAASPANRIQSIEEPSSPLKGSSGEPAFAKQTTSILTKRTGKKSARSHLKVAFDETPRTGPLISPNKQEPPAQTGLVPERKQLNPLKLNLQISTGSNPIKKQKISLQNQSNQNSIQSHQEDQHQQEKQLVQSKESSDSLKVSDSNRYKKHPIPQINIDALDPSNERSEQMLAKFKKSNQPVEVDHTSYGHMKEKVKEDFDSKCLSPFHHNYEDSKVTMYKNLEQTHQLGLHEILEMEGVPDANKLKKRQNVKGSMMKPM